MRNSEILTYAIYLTCGLAVLLGVTVFILLMAAEAYSHTRQPRQRARGPHLQGPASDGYATDGRPTPSGVPPAGPLTHNFKYEQCSIPAGLTLTQWRHGAGR